MYNHNNQNYWNVIAKRGTITFHLKENCKSFSWMTLKFLWYFLFTSIKFRILQLSLLTETLHEYLPALFSWWGMKHYLWCWKAKIYLTLATSSWLAKERIVSPCIACTISRFLPAQLVFFLFEYFENDCNKLLPSLFYAKKWIF